MTLLRPLVRKRPPAVIRLIVPNVLGRASPPPHEARIGLDARIHALYYTVPEMRPTIPNPNWTGDVNGWGRGL